MVEQAPRHRRCGVREWQLLGRHFVAAHRAMGRDAHRLAQHVCVYRIVLRCGDGLAGFAHARASAATGTCTRQPHRCGGLRQAVWFVGIASAMAAQSGSRRLLCGHGHAASAYRGVLQRLRFRRGTWRGNVVADVGLRHRQPLGFRCDLRPHRRHTHFAAGLGVARYCAVDVFTV